MLTHHNSFDSEIWSDFNIRRQTWTGCYKWEVDLNSANDAKWTVSMSALCHYATAIVLISITVFFSHASGKKKCSFFGRPLFDCIFVSFIFFLFVPLLLTHQAINSWDFDGNSACLPFCSLCNTNTISQVHFICLVFGAYLSVNINVTIWHADLSMCKYLFIVQRHIHTQKNDKSKADRLQSCNNVRFSYFKRHKS